MKILKENIFGKDSKIVKNYLESKKIYNKIKVLNDKIKNDFKNLENAFKNKNNYNFPEKYEFRIEDNKLINGTINIIAEDNKNSLNIMTTVISNIKKYEDIEDCDKVLYNAIYNEIDKLFLIKKYFKNNVDITYYSIFNFNIPKEFVDYRNTDLKKYVNYLEIFRDKFNGQYLRDEIVDQIYYEINQNKEIFEILKEYI